MSITNKLTKLETDISNAYDSIENKNGTIPQNKNTENLVNAINSISGGSSTANIFIQSTQPESYDGIWIKDETYKNYPVIEVVNINSLVASSINIIQGYDAETILHYSNMGDFTYNFSQVLITNSNNEIVFNIPIYYGDGTKWIEITAVSNVDVFYDGQFKLIDGFGLGNLGGTNASYTVTNVITFTGTSSYSTGLVYKMVSNKTVDFTLAKKLKITLSDTGSNDSAGVWIALESNPDAIMSYNDIINSPSKLDYILNQTSGNYNGTITLDTSSITGKYYIFFYLSRGTGSNIRKTTVVSKIEIVYDD